jgi:hypothetical protein
MVPAQTIAQRTARECLEDPDLEKEIWVYVAMYPDEPASSYGCR